MRLSRCAGLILLLGLGPEAFSQTPKLQALIITGQNNHDWRGTTPVLRKLLEDTGRFEVRVTEDFRGAGAELVTSVCTGSFVLAHAGLLTGVPVTTHWESIGTLRAEFPELEVREDERWVDADRIITSAGVSAGIDMALHIVARLYGQDVARATALGIEYDAWD